MAEASQSPLHNQIDRVRTNFTTLRSTRQQWDDLLNRNRPVINRDEIRAIAEGLDYQTPDLKKFVRDYISVGKMNPTIYDIQSTDTSQEAKKKLRQVLLWTGRGWEYENEGRVFDRNMIQGQVQHGLAIARYMWREAYVPSLDKELDADEYNKQREQQLKKQKYPFYWSFPSIYGVAWIGDEESEEGPDWFCYEATIPFVEAERLYGSAKKDQKMTLDDLGDIAWVDRDLPWEYSGNVSVSERQVKVTVIDCKVPGEYCDMPGCSHCMRKICIYLCGENDTATEDDYVEEYESPFPGCSFFVVGGDIRGLERDPHYRYPPLLYEAYVEAEWTNFLTVELAAQMLEDYGPNRYYMNYGRSDPAFFQIDGQLQLEYDFGRTSEGKIQAFPGAIERMPSSISPHFLPLLNVHQERLQRYAPNRFLLGEANTEASNSTSTAYIAAQQQAGLLPSLLLGEIDRAQLKSRRYAYHAIRYWGTFEPDGVKTPYTVPATGNDSFIKYASATVKPGEVATIDADLLESLDFDIVVRTKADTLAEQGTRYFQAKDKYQTGVITFEQFLRESGSDDIQGQLEAIDLMKTRQGFAPLQVQLDNMEILRIFEAGTGIATGLNLSQPPAQPQPQEPQGGMAPPTGVGGSAAVAMGLMGNHSMGRAEAPSGGSSPIQR